MFRIGPICKLQVATCQFSAFTNSLYYNCVSTVVVVWSYKLKSYGLVRLHRNAFIAQDAIIAFILTAFWMGCADRATVRFFNRDSHVTELGAVHWTYQKFIQVRRTEINYSSLNCTNEFLICAVCRTTPITMLLLITTDTTVTWHPCAHIIIVITIMSL